MHYNIRYFQEVKLRDKPSIIMRHSKLMLALILLVVCQFSLALPWPVESDRLVKEDPVRAQELEDVVNELSEALKQDTAPHSLREGETEPGIEKQAIAMNDDVNEQENSQPNVQRDGYQTVSGFAEDAKSQRNERRLTKKVLESLRKERERKEGDRLLQLHRLFLFQKPQMRTASAESFQDFINYFKGVGQRIKDFFTKYPVDHKQMAQVEEESDANVQEIEEALVQEMFLDLLKSMARSRVRKRDTNDRDFLLQVLNGLPHVTVNYHKNANSETTLITKNEALQRAIPDEKSLPKLPTHTTALSIPYTASSEDIPTVVPAMGVTLIQDTQEQN